MKTRRTKIGVYHCEVSTSWDDSQLKFVDSSGQDRKEVWIHIERPSDIDYIKEHLDEIRDEWKKQLAILG